MYGFGLGESQLGRFVVVGDSYVVEFAEEAREGDVAVVVERGVAEDEDAVLYGRVVRL
jgi:hypothetical protein